MNAIILAAGMGTRLKPITEDIPKPLLKVLNKPLIERQIEYLLEKDIDEIIIISGYKKEKLDYLKKKYGVKIIYNNRYNEYNNIYSMYLARQYLGDTYVLEGDVFLDKNIFIKNIVNSTYFAVKKSEFNNEWVINSNEKLKVESITVETSKDKYILSGISYWNLGDSKFIVKKIEESISSLKFKELYWDDIIRNNIKSLDINLKPLDKNICYEIDSIEDLKKLEKILYKKKCKYSFDKSKDENIRSELTQYLDLAIVEKYTGPIKSINKIGGMTNLNFKISNGLQRFVVRVCKQDTKNMINRVDEKRNNYLAYELGIDESFLHIDEVYGLKISKFIDEGINLTPKTARKRENMIKVVRILKKLHTSNVNLNNIFNPFEMIRKYETILKEIKGCFFGDYNEVRKKIFYLSNIIESYKLKLVACHNDTVPENFIINKEELNIIDWEYSGMNDPMWDLASHILECNFSREEENQFINLYFDYSVNKQIYERIYIYKILQDFLWSLWANIKISYGEDLKSYAKERYDRSKLLLNKFLI